MMVPSLMLMLALAQGNPPENLQAIAAEPNLVKRARLALQRGDRDTNQAGQACKDGDYDSCNAELNHVREDVELADRSLKETGIDPARSPRHFKEAELHIRKILRSIEAVRAYLRPEDLDHFDTIYQRISEIDDRLVAAILSRKKKK
ncbi:MAG TPA: hypothetical protein VFA54_07425 [Bryobacterales bacterium]|jgi:hypothetical protein|nr:hypothetical protein [Bryobacterales bacterium]